LSTSSDESQDKALTTIFGSMVTTLRRATMERAPLTLEQRDVLVAFEAGATLAGIARRRGRSMKSTIRLRDRARDHVEKQVAGLGLDLRVCYLTRDSSGETD
jgi:hypothetical protein